MDYEILIEYAGIDAINTVDVCKYTCTFLDCDGCFGNDCVILQIAQ